MTMPLTRVQLDHGRCAVPGCDHKDHDVLFLNQRCHTGAGVEVSYNKHTGLLTVACRVCKKLVADIAVAER